MHSTFFYYIIVDYMSVTGVGVLLWIFGNWCMKTSKKKYSFQNKHLHIQITDILKFYVVLLFTNCKGLGFFLSSKNSHYAYIHPYMHKILPILGNKIEQ